MMMMLLTMNAIYLQIDQIHFLLMLLSNVLNIHYKQVDRLYIKLYNLLLYY
jgi:hypothetical protein